MVRVHSGLPFKQSLQFTLSPHIRFLLAIANIRNLVSERYGDRGLRFIANYPPEI